MNALLGVSRLIDSISGWVGKSIRWLILIVVVISAANAIIRKTFDVSSNAWLEVQWYLFAAVFLLGAGYVFMTNAHVRIDFISSRLTARARNWIDVVGIIAFLIPLCIIVIKLSWPLFQTAFTTGESSQNAGGLIRWPVFLMMPLGFALLLMQAFSELIKRVAYLRGVAPDSIHDGGEKTDEEKLLEELAAEAARKEEERLRGLAPSVAARGAK